MNALKVGDKVIYPNQGLGIIENIQEENYFGQNFQIYHVRILANDTLVLVPSSNAEEIGIRKPISQDSIQDIFDFIRNDPGYGPCPEKPVLSPDDQAFVLQREKDDGKGERTGRHGDFRGFLQFGRRDRRPGSRNALLLFQGRSRSHRLVTHFISSG